MSKPLGRREFLATTTLAAVATPLSRLGSLPSLDGRPAAAAVGSPTADTARDPGPAITGAPIAPRARPFALKDVRLRPGLQLDALHVNRRFMMALEPDRLLHMFRVTAGLPSNAQAYGGWEAADNELRGHFTGHYLSACALMAAQTGDAALNTRAAGLIAELAKCQQANTGGYLSAFPTTFFDRLRRHERVWAPFYTYHKIMAGLLDNYTLGGNRQALDVARGMAGWAIAFATPIPDDEWQKVLMTEFGGMNEVLYNLYAVTGDAAYAELAHRFDHAWLFDPLAEARDQLTNVHGNTNIPKVIGAARRYELMGEARYHTIATYFWDEVAGRRSYVTGGTTSGEAWRGEPGQLQGTLSGYTEETCPTYNMLKLTRHLFTWRPDARLADYYERAWFNGILPTQHPADGDKLYYTPLAAGYWKLFGTLHQDFWCCTGTGVENFSKSGDSIYFHDDTGIWVNLFVPSEVHWPDRGVHLVQETTFPASDATTLVVHTPKPLPMALRVRIPWWATSGGTARLNGRVLDALAAPGGYLVLERSWHDGDRLELTLPMTLHTQSLPGDDSLQSVMYGPLVLVGRMGKAGLTSDNLRAIPTPPRTVPEYVHPDPPPTPVIRTTSPDAAASWIEPVPGRPLTFRTHGQGESMELVPLYALFDERYVVYWKVQKG